MGRVFLERPGADMRVWDVKWIARGEVRELIDPLAARLFGQGPQHMTKLRETKTGQVAVGLFFETKYNSLSSPDYLAPADLMTAHQDNSTRKISAAWHVIQVLGAPRSDCIEAGCLRLEYGMDGGDLVVATADGNPADVNNRSKMYGALRVILSSLIEGGVLYDPSWSTANPTNELTRRIVNAGHPLSIPDAAEVGELLRLSVPVQGEYLHAVPADRPEVPLTFPAYELAVADSGHER